MSRKGKEMAKSIKDLPAIGRALNSESWNWLESDRRVPWFQQEMRTVWRANG